jgi:hypothetical protein
LYNTYIDSNKQELKMARKTKAEQQAEREAEQALRVEVAKATYTQRMMAVLTRAVKENFELEVKNMLFKVEDRDDRRSSPYMLYPEWTTVSDMALYDLELAVELKEEARAESERRANLRTTALNKLTEEEREALGL